MQLILAFACLAALALAVPTTQEPVTNDPTYSPNDFSPVANRLSRLNIIILLDFFILINFRMPQRHLVQPCLGEVHRLDPVCLGLHIRVHSSQRHQ